MKHELQLCFEVPSGTSIDGNTRPKALVTKAVLRALGYEVLAKVHQTAWGFHQARGRVWDWRNFDYDVWWDDVVKGIEEVTR